MNEKFKDFFFEFRISMRKSASIMIMKQADYDYCFSGEKNISILHLSYRTSDLQFSLILQTHALFL